MPQDRRNQTRTTQRSSRFAVLTGFPRTSSPDRQSWPRSREDSLNASSGCLTIVDTHRRRAARQLQPIVSRLPCTIAYRVTTTPMITAPSRSIQPIHGK
jgi:hypothetical protein